MRLKGFPPDLLRRAQKRLRQLHAARTLQDLRLPPSNRLEALERERQGQHSIRINDQWRIGFVWRDGDAYDVEVTDYQEGDPVTISMEDLRAGRVEFDDLIDTEARTLGPVHPGEILRDCLDELGLSAYGLAKAIRVPVNRVTAILAGRRAVTADTALRLARCFGTSAELWLSLQAGYDLEVARNARGAAIDAEVQPQAA